MEPILAIVEKILVAIILLGLGLLILNLLAEIKSKATAVIILWLIGVPLYTIFLSGSALALFTYSEVFLFLGVCLGGPVFACVLRVVLTIYIDVWEHFLFFRVSMAVSALGSLLLLLWWLMKGQELAARFF